MSNINTELNEAVSKGTNLSDAWNELMRKELEHAINELLQSELTSFLDYEKWDIAGYNSGNSRNGSYAREIVTRFGFPSTEGVTEVWKRWSFRCTPRESQHPRSRI